MENLNWVTSTYCNQPRVSGLQVMVPEVCDVGRVSSQGGNVHDEVGAVGAWQWSPVLVSLTGTVPRICYTPWRGTAPRNKGLQDLPSPYSTPLKTLTSIPMPSTHSCLQSSHPISHSCLACCVFFPLLAFLPSLFSAFP